MNVREGVVTMSLERADTNELLARAEQGDSEAVDQLLERHRQRLRQMVALRMDQRLAARVDPSDVVQEALAEAAHRLLDYLRDRPLPFYLWMRELAWQRLVDLTRRHLRAHCRSLGREAFSRDQLNDASALHLARHWIGSGSSPSRHLRREDQKRLVHSALAQLDPADRELVVLRHLEQLSMREVAAVLNVSESTARYRQRRVLEQLADLISEI